MAKMCRPMAPQQSARGIAFFDLDHTLVDGDSDTSFLGYLAERLDFEPEVEEEKSKIHQAYLEGQPWQEAYRRLLVRIYGGREVATLREWSAVHARERVLPMLFAGARELLERERGRRRQLCLLTTTNQVVTEPLVQELGLDVLLSTRLEEQDGVLNGRLVGDFCTGPGKARALLDHCRREQVDPADCAMFGDGRSDMEALAAVGEPVAVHPTPGLRDQARRLAWPILDLRDGIRPQT